MLTAATVRSLPVPTDSQWEAFVEHLVTVHSWYKHLPLFNGGDFVVFLALDAGQCYPKEHSKLPTENTSDGYRRAFGHLDYIYRAQSTEPFCRDGPPTPQIDDDLLSFGRFSLYPYVSREFYWSVHEADVVRIRNGASHPHAAAIIDAYDAEQRMDQCWGELSESDRDLIVSFDDSESADQRSLPDSIVRYRHLEQAAYTAYDKLHEPEVLKVRRCLNTVRQWLA